MQPHQECGRDINKATEQRWLAVGRARGAPCQRYLAGKSAGLNDSYKLQNRQSALIIRLVGQLADQLRINDLVMFIDDDNRAGSQPR